MQLLVQIFEAKQDQVKAAGYKPTLQDEMWKKERNAIERLRPMSAFKASGEIGVNYLVELLPNDADATKRWKQIKANVYKRSLGFCGSGHGYNLLHAVVEFGQEDTVCCLLEIEEHARLLNLDSFVDVQDHDGNAPLHFAAKGRLEIVRVFLKHGADVNVNANDGRTPLIVAIKSGSLDIVRLLLDNKADITAKDEHGWAALHHAVFEGEGEIIELLLENGADVGIVGASGRTPLHCAAVRGREDIVRLLLEKGANIGVRSNDDKTPQDLAEKNRRDIAARILRCQTKKGH
jgi:ankyrin repeat protein